jgi:hypothetical protein
MDPDHGIMYGTLRRIVIDLQISRRRRKSGEKRRTWHEELTVSVGQAHHSDSEIFETHT